MNLPPLPDGLLVEVRNHVAFLTLNRPNALNALSFEMIEGMAALFAQWSADPDIRAVVTRGAGEKAYCAGGDVRGLYASLTGTGSEIHHRFFRVEYALNYQLHRFLKNTGKPYIALIDGIVMGGGMGVSQGATLRIVGDRTRMAMPETTIGLFPDVGGSYFLSRCPGAVGLYLGLVGVTIRAADARYANLADLEMSADAQQAFFAALDELAWTEDNIADVVRLARAHARNSTEAEGELIQLRPAIERHFEGKASAAAIVESLRSETDEQFVVWAEKTVALLEKRSPTMLEVTKRQIELGARMKLADCLRLELNLIEACFQQRDLVEGIRALLIDKDNRPVWQAATLADVTADSVDRFFTPFWPADEHPLRDLESRFG